jgi:hypothetical protein
VEWDGENSTCDPPIKVRFRAKFSSDPAAQEFLDLIKEASDNISMIDAISELIFQGVDLAAQAPPADEEYEDDEEEELLYNHPASLYYISNGVEEVKGSGDLIVRFDEDVLGYRIMMEKVISADDGDSIIFINHIICRDHRLVRLVGSRSSVNFVIMVILLSSGMMVKIFYNGLLWILQRMKL